MNRYLRRSTGVLGVLGREANSLSQGRTALGGRRAHRWVSAAAAILTQAGAAGVTRHAGGWVDPSIAQVRSFGRPAGGCPVDRVDAGRTACSREPLPRHPIVTWQRRTPGPLAVAPVVDSEGAILTANTQGVLTQIDARGVLGWQAELGAAPASAPVILSDLGIVVVTATGEAVAWTPAGQRRWAAELPSRAKTLPAPLPREDGSLVLAVDYTLVRLDPTGETRLQVTVPELPVALLEYGDTTLVVEEQGRVQVWAMDGHLETLGSLGGPVRASAVLAGEHLIAPVGDGKLMDLELRTGRRGERWPGSKARVLTAPAVSPPGKLTAVDSEGILLIEPAPARAPLQVPLATSPARGGLAGPPQASPLWLPPVVDEQGTAIVVAPGLEFAAVHAGQVHLVQGTGCSTPIAVVPAGSRRVVVVCASGLIVSLAELTPVPGP